MTNDAEHYTDCDWCATSMAYGNAMVCLSRSIEQIDRTDEHPDGEVTVIEVRTSTSCDCFPYAACSTPAFG